jgi:uncharacterized lipoprotein YmbA
MLRLLAAGLLLIVAACASPDPILFTLAAQPGEILHTAAGPVELRHVGLARYLDRTGIVRTPSSYRVTVTDSQRWAEPLSAMLERIIGENLAMRLPDNTVYTEPSGIFQVSPAVVEVNVQRFDPDPSGEVVLAAQASVQNPDGRGAPVSRSFRVTRQPASSTTEDAVAAMSAALGEFSDGLARLIAQR